MNTQPIQVLIVDDHAIVRQGIRALFYSYEDIQLIGEASTGMQAIELTERLKPDVVLMDLLMPGVDGIEAIKRLLAIQPGLPIVVLTAYLEENMLVTAIKAGAMGYVLKEAEPEELIQSIRTVYAGEPALNPKTARKLLHAICDTAVTRPPAEKLTEREIDILRLLSLGKSDQEIANQLALTGETVRMQLSQVFTKLGVKDPVLAALLSFA